VADLIEFLYSTGWRVSAGRGLEWRDVDLIHGTVTMRSELSKNKEPITLPFFAGIEEILQRRHGLRRAECPFVFHRNGRPIKDFRAEWAKATEAAKRTGLFVHDLSRSAARNLSRAGVHETVASKFVNRQDAGNLQALSSGGQRRPAARWRSAGRLLERRRKGGQSRASRTVIQAVSTQ